MRLGFRKEELIFKKSAKTSRGILTNRPIAFLELFNAKNQIIAQGEIAPINGLSVESWFDIEKEISRLSDNKDPLQWSTTCSSLQFAIDCIQGQLNSGSITEPFVNQNKQFEILLNGLVWMNDISEMIIEAHSLVERGFSAVKFKIGSLNWNDELHLLSSFRKTFPEIEVRVDANGAFAQDALVKLNQLSEFNIHSIEQPIAKGNWRAMAELCYKSPIPIAFDEELIAWNDDLLRFFEENGLPQYLILKPSLHGGIEKCNFLTNWAVSNQVQFWITSYLESNIGLSHLANWICSKNWNFRHGLGTGALFERNFEERWRVENGYLKPVKT